MATTSRLLEVIIPVYLSEPSLYPIVSECLESLYHTYPDISVRVVNDCSPLPFPDEWLDWVSYYQKMFENRGYTAAVNAGLRTSEADIMVIANDDLIFKTGDLDRFSELEGLVIGSPMDTAASPDDAFGAVWGLTREAFELLGPLDESYKHFFSDREYYERAKLKGVRIEKWLETTIDHRESATYKTVNKEELFALDLATYEERHKAHW